MLRCCISDYKIPKVVIIRSFTFTLICRSIQLIIILFCGIMVYENGYQIGDDSIISLVTLAVKGMNYKPIEQNRRLLIDNADYIGPSQEKDALFIMTNSIQTDQEYKICPESFDNKGVVCVNDSHCQLNQDSRYRNGRRTGRCLVTTGRCEIKGWCPVMNDYDMPTSTPSQDTLNFTILLKNFIKFNYFKVTKSNIVSSLSYLRQCIYDPVHHKLCPTFRIGTLLDIVEPDPNEQKLMLQFGGIIHINIDWFCNLDRPLNQCLPKYSFDRLDTVFKPEFSAGFNFRSSSHWKSGNRSFRTLTKAYGLRFFLSVNGYARRFHLIVLIANIILLIAPIYLITFIIDSIGLHIYCRSAVDQSQISENVVEESKRKNEQARLTE